MLLRQSRAYLLLAPAAALAAYAALLGRGFTSEDFLLIRYLGEHPPWRHLAEQLSAPWLGISGIRFLRPLSTTLYAVEIALFGPHPPGFNCVHVLVHALNALLVGAVLHALLGGGGSAARGRRAAVAGGLLFALHPLHPNAVIFSASFATLFGATFVFAALLAYLRYRDTGRWSWWALSFVAFGCALLSYEAAAVLPLWLAAADHIAAPGPPRTHLRRVAGWLPFAALLAVYFAWRLWVFGVVLGGYDATSQRLLASQPLELVAVVASSVRRLLLPYYGRAIGPAALAVATGVLVVAPAPWLLACRDARATRGWLTGWVWLLAGLAPFGFEPMVPGNGRYGYLAAAGAALAAAGALLAELPAHREPRRGWRILPWVAAAALALVWSALLAEHLRICARAAEVAARVRRTLIASEPGLPGGPRFVTGYPYFLSAGNGDPAAQVFHYGLRDAVNPPFAHDRVDVLPLPPLAGDELLPVLRGAGAGHVVEWTPPGELRPAAAPATSPLVELTAETTAASPERPAASVRLPAGPFRRFRLLVSAPINGAVFDVPPPPAGTDLLRVEMPMDFLHTNAVLYGHRTVYWWLEVRDEAGVLTGYTRLQPLAAAAQGAEVSIR